MHRFLALAVPAALIGANAFAQVVELRTGASSEDRYHRISFVSEGPVTPVIAGPVRGRYFRLVVHEGKFTGEPPSLRIETLTHGGAGCCRTLERSRDVEFEPLSASFGPFDATKAQFEFGLWLGPSAFEFTYAGVTLWMSQLDQDRVKVQRAKKGAPVVRPERRRS